MPHSELEVDELARRIVRPDAQAVVANNAERIYGFWKALHVETTIPSNSQDLDACIMKAFQYLDSTMLDQEMPHQLSRLSHVALTNMVGNLKKAIAANRRQGKIESRSGYRNAAVVMDLYLNSQGLIANRLRAKRELNRRMQTSRRWTELSRGCPLLLVTHADAAESLISNRKISNVTLGAIGARLLVLVRPSIVQVLNRLQALAETDVQANTAGAQKILEHVISTKALLVSGI